MIDGGQVHINGCLVHEVQHIRYIFAQLALLYASLFLRVTEEELGLDELDHFLCSDDSIEDFVVELRITLFMPFQIVVGVVCRVELSNVSIHPI